MAEEKEEIKILLTSIIKKIKQIICKHKFESMGKERYIGETCNWSFSLQPQFEQVYECVKCGKRKKKKYIYWGNIKNLDGSYNFKNK